MIDAAVRHQTMAGFGASVRVFDDPGVFFDTPAGRAAPVMTTAQQDEILDRLYRDLRLSRVRPTSPDATAGAGIEIINDNDNPYITDLSRFNFNGGRLDAQLDYFAHARTRGANTLFLSPTVRETWMATSTSNDVAEYSEWLLAQVRRARQLGTPLHFLSVANNSSAVSTPLSGEFIRDVIKNLGPRLQVQGFDARFVLPIDLTSGEAASSSQIVLGDPDAISYVGALEARLGGQSVSRISQVQAIASQYQLPLWLSDSSISDSGNVATGNDASEWASYLHEAVSAHNVSAVDYAKGFAGIPNSDVSALMTLIASEDAYAGYTLNKSYFATGQYSRFVLPGAQRIDAQSSDANVESTAYLSAEGLVVVLINNSDVNQEVTFDLRGVAAARFSRVRTSPTENWATLPAVLPEQSAFKITLPPRSIETLSSGLLDIAAGDFDENGNVNADDLLAWKGGYGRSIDVAHADGDANGDLVVDGTDLLQWQRDLGTQNIEMQGDFNGVDGVNDADLSVWRDGFGLFGVASARQGDADGDLDVDGADYLLWQRNLLVVGRDEVTGMPVPEPMSIAICVYALSITRRPRHRLERPFTGLTPAMAGG
ncbi:glycoside hydrolase family 30 beta sandwich domain-containing protein [Lacipirellula limnantheis]|uniref:glycoside hydrolase family 30 beta sandwich domain-containing protein n=1 Tax=Lacipirellula limnantheis TaxID=2528024 RepID=UPI00143D52D5|nr:glycoside hydrolase family 30 beta sandwich domain-containing protein [Lacipirellula limnantheis]